MLYAGAEGVAVVMRAKSAPGGRSTREVEREVKEPGLCSTRRRRERLGATQGGIASDPLEGVDVEAFDVLDVLLSLLEEVEVAGMLVVAGIADCGILEMNRHYMVRLVPKVPRVVIRKSGTGREYGFFWC